jgi:4a-hydroxytetrahydrobiopterin dehydratase
MRNLNEQEIHNRIKKMNISWIIEDKLIHREIVFKDFVEAFSFMTAVAIKAEESDHHPECKNIYDKVNITLNTVLIVGHRFGNYSHNKVNITLDTHDACGLTNKDFQLAKGIDQILKNYANL